jgi:pyrroline-5-carboxylate reductase
MNVGCFPNGRVRRRTVTLRNVRPDASADQLAMVVRALEKVIAHPIIRVRVVKKYILVANWGMSLLPSVRKRAGVKSQGRFLVFGAHRLRNAFEGAKILHWKRGVLRMNQVPAIGFVGTGVLASSMVRGICSSPELREARIVVSPRNAEAARNLAALYENVLVARSNQEVLDKADWVTLSVVPAIAESVAGELEFRPDHTVISVVATKRLKTVRSWMPGVSRLFRMVPMPFIARRVGPIALYPGSGDIEEFFGHLGRVFVMDAEPQVELANAITSVTNATYTLIENVAAWGEENGLPHGRSRDYTISYFAAMLDQIAGDRASELPRFVEERTPGGMNDSALRLIAERGGFGLWADALGTALKKIRAEYL